jgi:hypothetical protein
VRCDGDFPTRKSNVCGFKKQFCSRVSRQCDMRGGGNQRGSRAPMIPECNSHHVQQCGTSCHAVDRYGVVGKAKDDGCLCRVACDASHGTGETSFISSLSHSLEVEGYMRERKADVTLT